MTDRKFLETAHEYGLDSNLAEFLLKFVSRRPHTHTADQIEDLSEFVTELVEDMDAEDREA